MTKDPFIPVAPLPPDLNLSGIYGLLNSRVKQLPNQSYKLAGGQYGLNVILDDKIEVDESKMCATFRFADGRMRDGVGDLLNVAGIDTSRHQLNPCILLDHGKGEHKFSSWPIAMAQDPETSQYTVQINGEEQWANATGYFYQGKGHPGLDKESEYEFAVHCEQIFDLIVKGFLRSGSIGYQVKAARELPPDYETGTPKGLHLLAVKMLEASIVIVPANQDTVGKGFDSVREILSRDQICGKPLSPYLVKCLTPYASKPKSYATNPLESRDDYENPLSDGAVPVPDWKPGLGVKELRRRYRKALQPASRYAVTHAGSEQQIRPGQTVIARTYLGPTKPDGTPDNDVKKPGFAATGERLTVVRVDGSTVWLRNSKGEEARHSVGKVRTKGMPVETKSVQWATGKNGGLISKDSESGRKFEIRREPSPDGASNRWYVYVDGTRTGIGYSFFPNAKYNADLLDSGQGKSLQVETKSLNNVRVKYRGPARRRLRKSVAGVSHVVVSHKDFEAVKALAGQRGLQLKQLDSDDATVKMKLIGDDTAIDEIAKLYGKSLMASKKSGPLPIGVVPDPKGREREALEYESQLNSSLGSEIKSKRKAMNPEEAGEDLIDRDDDAAAEGKALEPYGAQCLRKVHEDHKTLIKDYEDMIALNDHPHVKKHLEGLQQHHAKTLDDTEKLFTKHYKDLDGLEDSEEHEAEEEEHKDLEEGGEDNEGPDEAVRADSDPPADEEPPPAELAEEHKRLTARMKKLNAKIKAFKKGVCPECGKENCTCKKAMPDAETQMDKMDEVAEVHETKGGLEPHEEAALEDAKSYMKEISEPGSEFSDEHRMKAYHHHKNLESIAESHGKSEGEIPNDMETNPIQAEDEADFDVVKGMETESSGPLENMEAIKGCSSFMKELSTAHDFGDVHRQKAVQFHKALGGEDVSEGETIEEADEVADVNEPGETGEKDMEDDEEKSLPFLLAEKALRATELTKQVAELRKRFSVKV